MYVFALVHYVTLPPSKLGYERLLEIVTILQFDKKASKVNHRNMELWKMDELE